MKRIIVVIIVAVLALPVLVEAGFFNRKQEYKSTSVFRTETRQTPTGTVTESFSQTKTQYPQPTYYYPQSYYYTPSTSGSQPNVIDLGKPVAAVFDGLTGIIKGVFGILTCAWCGTGSTPATQPEYHQPQQPPESQEQPAEPSRVPGESLSD